MQNCQNLHGTILCDPKTHLPGLCGRPSAWMPPIVSQDVTQSVWGPTLGSPGHPGSGKIKNILTFTHFGVAKKNTSQKAPKYPKNAKKKANFFKNEAVSSKNFAYDHMPNVLGLTDELGNFGSRIDGPEICPRQNWGGGVEEGR